MLKFGVARELGLNGLADVPGDAFSGGVHLVACFAEGGDIVEVAVLERRDDGGDDAFEFVEVHHGVDGIELVVIAADGDAKVPVVAVERFEAAVGQAEGVTGGKRGVDGGVEQNRYSML